MDICYEICNKDNICYAESNFDYFVFNAIGILIFCLWDWTVIILYAIKVHQIKKEKTNLPTKSRENILKRISVALQKILFLTILF